MSSKTEVVRQAGGKFIHLFHVTTEKDGKSVGPWEIASRKLDPFVTGNHTPDAVVIVAIHEGKLVVIREFRYSLGANMWGFPAGCLDEGQTVFECAQNELKQETGLDMDENDVIRSRSYVFPSAGLTDEMHAIVFCNAHGKLSKDYLEGHEIIDTHLLSYDELKALRDSDDYISSRLMMMIEGLHTFHAIANQDNALGWK